MSGAGSSSRRYLLLLALLTVVHGLLAAGLPLSGDEAYYWDCSRHLDWSYFDQPPLAIWAMVPARALLGESRLGVRAPALVSSFLVGLFLLPLARRLGGGEAEAAWAYLVLHGTPLFFLGAFYASTDVVMIAAYVAATWSAVAIAQGEEKAWWGFGLALGLGFLAKNSAIVAASALAPLLARAAVRRRIVSSPAPWLGALVAVLLAAPVFVWGSLHGWDNLVFQLSSRHVKGTPLLRNLFELLVGNLVLATPLLAAALVVALVLAARRRESGWPELVAATAGPLLVFTVVALRTRVSPHWTAPAIVLGALALALNPFRGRRTLVATGVVVGLLVSCAALAVVVRPTALLGLEWHYAGRPYRISTAKLGALLGNRQIAAEVAARRRGDELVASESYTTVHLIAFLSGGAIPTLLAHVKPGKHGLASLYWYPPQALEGRDALFVTEKRQVDGPLGAVFAEVEEEAPIEIARQGRVVRSLRVLRCRRLLRPQGVFTRLGRSGRGGGPDGPARAR